MNRGFTLLEILIAIVIFAVVITTLFSSFNAFIQSSEQVKESVLTADAISNVNKRISLDLKSIFVVQTPRYQKPKFDSDPDSYRLLGSEETVGQQVFSFLTFTSLAHAKLQNNQTSSVARIAYYVKENEYNGMDLCRADVLPPFSDDIKSGDIKSGDIKSCNDPILYQNISGFEVVYTDFNQDEYKYWDSDASEFQYTFPKTIELKITFRAIPKANLGSNSNSGLDTQFQSEEQTDESKQVSVISINIVQGR